MDGGLDGVISRQCPRPQRAVCDAIAGTGGVNPAAKRSHRATHLRFGRRDLRTLTPRAPLGWNVESELDEFVRPLHPRP
jgi:hypothetical protein